jgi:uncharacterized protein YndB with AHSA1/START domain
MACLVCQGACIPEIYAAYSRSASGAPCLRDGPRDARFLHPKGIAMPAITCTTTINAPPDRVFAVFADLRNADKNVKGIKKIEVLTDGPIGKGTRFRETRAMFGREQTETMEVTDFQPPRSYTVEANSCGCLCRSQFEFRPEGAGTAVQMNFQTTPLTFFAKLMSPLMGLMAKTCKKMIDRDFADLKALAEKS